MEPFGDLIGKDALVPISDIQNLYAKIRREGGLPPRDKGKEEIFYRDVNPRIDTKRWLKLIYSDRNPDAPIDPKWVGLSNLQELYMLATIEKHRECELFYVNLILDLVSQGVIDYSPYVPQDTFERIVTKYRLASKLRSVVIKRKYTRKTIPVEAPIIPSTAHDEDPITEIELTKLHEEHVDDRREVKKRVMSTVRPEDLEVVRTSLIRCLSIPKIAKTLSYRSNTHVYQTIAENMFLQPTELLKNIDVHVGAVKRAMEAGRTWEYYIHTRAICERALFKALLESDPSFVIENKIVPSCDSVMFEFESNKFNMNKTANAFGVSISTMEMWINNCGEPDVVYSPRGIKLPKTLKSKKSREEIERGAHRIFSDEDVELMDDLRKQRMRER